MKKMQLALLAVSTILLLSTTVQAALTVMEYVPGQKVVLDTATGNYWYWNLPDFENMTYADQTTAIAGLGNYGGLLGGWHMATRVEMDALWVNLPEDLQASFMHTYDEPYRRIWVGRYDEIMKTDHHHIGESTWYKGSGLRILIPLGTGYLTDLIGIPRVGAWVTTSVSVIPAPGALALTVTGLLTLFGSQRCRRRQ